VKPQLKAVAALPDFRLLLTFDNAEKRILDVRPYLTKGVFAELADESLFRSAHVDFDTVAWGNGADLCPEVLYAESEPAKDALKETAANS
jgi:hypothetical protein